MESKYEKGDVVYIISCGQVVPLIISNIWLINGSYLYEFDYDEYMNFIKSAKESGFDFPEQCLLEEGSNYYEEDLYKDMEHIRMVMLESRQVLNVLNNLK